MSVSRSVLILVLGVSIMSGCGQPQVAPEPERPGFALAIHGGAGVIERHALDAETEAAYRAALAEALAAGQRVLEAGGSGGIIAVDPAGNIVLRMNTPGMYRASLRSGGAPVIAIFADEAD